MTTETTGPESPERFAEWENAAIGDPVTLFNPDPDIGPCDAVDDAGFMCTRDKDHGGEWHVATAASHIRAKWVTR